MSHKTMPPRREQHQHHHHPSTYEGADHAFTWLYQTDGSRNNSEVSGVKEMPPLSARRTPGHVFARPPETTSRSRLPKPEGCQLMEKHRAIHDGDEGKLLQASKTTKIDYMTKGREGAKDPPPPYSTRREDARPASPTASTL